MVLPNSALRKSAQSALQCKRQDVGTVRDAQAQVCSAQVRAVAPGLARAPERSEALLHHIPALCLFLRERQYALKLKPCLSLHQREHWDAKATAVVFSASPRSCAPETARALKFEAGKLSGEKRSRKPKRCSRVLVVARVEARGHRKPKRCSVQVAWSALDLSPGPSCCLAKATQSGALQYESQDA